MDKRKKRSIIDFIVVLSLVVLLVLATILLLRSCQKAPDEVTPTPTYTPTFTLHPDTPTPTGTKPPTETAVPPTATYTKTSTPTKKPDDTKTATPTEEEEESENWCGSLIFVDGKWEWLSYKTNTACTGARFRK